MRNLIMNPCWRPGPGGGPLYFTSTGPITYDNFSVNGYRTCSITMSPGSTAAARDAYVPLIRVRAAQCIRWGFLIRAVEADSIVLAANFYDRADRLVAAERFPIADRITASFCLHTACFAIPHEAETVRLFIEFRGGITCCTYCAPTACFC